MNEAIIVGITLGLICSLIGHWIGRARGRPVAGFFFGLLLGPLGCLIVGVLPRENTVAVSRRRVIGPQKAVAPTQGWKD